MNVSTVDCSKMAVFKSDMFKSLYANMTSEYALHEPRVSVKLCVCVIVILVKFKTVMYSF